MGRKFREWQPEASWLFPPSPGDWLKASAHLNSIDTKDLHQEVIIPSADSSFHSEAVLAGMLFEQRQREAPNPC